MNEIEKLKRQVEVLREACSEAGVRPELNICRKALAEADRIAAEPVEASDWEVVAAWGNSPEVDPSREIGLYWDGLWLKWVELQPGTSRYYRDKHVEFLGGLDAAVREAAVWVRAQGGGRG